MFYVYVTVSDVLISQIFNLIIISYSLLIATHYGIILWFGSYQRCSTNLCSCLFAHAFACHGPAARAVKSLVWVMLMLRTYCLNAVLDPAPYCADVGDACAVINWLSTKVL